MRPTILLALLAASATLAASPACAHARLVASSPAAKAVVASPRKLSLSFSERLLPSFSKVELVMAMTGHPMTVPLKTKVDGSTMVSTPQGALIKGSYTMNWTAATSDGHRMTGSVPFQVK